MAKTDRTGRHDATVPRSGRAQTLGKELEMKLSNIFKHFKQDESGAVTVDWVVLTAAIVGLGMVVMATVGGGITNLSSGIASNLNSTTVGFQ